MKINWKVRFKHKTFLVALFSGVLILAQQVAGFFGVDTTVYNDQATDLFNTVLGLLVLLGVINDPTTKGVISDSDRALTYDKPKQD